MTALYAAFTAILIPLIVYLIIYAIMGREPDKYIIFLNLILYFTILDYYDRTTSERNRRTR